MELAFSDFLSGDIYQLKISDIDTFFKKNQYSLSTACVNTFLKSLKIPPSYFLKQPQETKIQLLRNQKDLISHDKDIFILKRGDLFEFCCLGDKDTLEEAINKSPINKKWIYLEENLNSGYIRFFIPFKDVKEDSYNLGLFIDYPILFSKQMLINVGFYKLNKEDSSLNYELVVPNNTIKLKNKNLPETSHNTYFDDLLKEVLECNLGKIITFLSDYNLDTEGCMNMLSEFQKEKKLPKFICSKIRNYIFKKNINLDNCLVFVENMFIFVNYIKTYSGRNKFKSSLLNCILSRDNKIPNLNLEYFKEGY